MTVHVAPPIALAAPLHRRSVSVCTISLDSLDGGMSLLDLNEHVAEAMQDLTEHEKHAARLFVGHKP